MPLWSLTKNLAHFALVKSNAYRFYFVNGPTFQFCILPILFSKILANPTTQQFQVNARNHGSPCNECSTYRIRKPHDDTKSNASILSLIYFIVLEKGSKENGISLDLRLSSPLIERTDRHDSS